MRRSPSGYLLLQFPERQFVGITMFFIGLLAFLIGHAFYIRAEANSRSSLADLPSQLIDLASSPSADFSKSPVSAPASQKLLPTKENEPEMKARLALFAEEFDRLKKYELQIQKRVDSLNAMIDEIDRLDNGADDASFTEPANARTRGKLGIGGADLRSAPTIHFNSRHSKPNLDFGKKSDDKIGTSLLLNELDLKLHRMSHMPMGAPVLAGITSGYGWRNSPFHKGGRFHSGVDLSVERNTPVVATADGIVIDAGRKGDYGIAVVIRHRDGIETLYGHLARASVTPGEKVCRGQKIGLVGSTGRSTGPHLHYEVRIDGDATNPKPYIELASYAKMLRSDVDSQTRQ